MKTIMVYGLYGIGEMIYRKVLVRLCDTRYLKMYKNLPLPSISRFTTQTSCKIERQSSCQIHIFRRKKIVVANWKFNVNEKCPKLLTDFGIDTKIEISIYLLSDAKSTGANKQPPLTFTDEQWNEMSPQISAIICHPELTLPSTVPFDAASDLPMDEQR